MVFSSIVFLYFFLPLFFAVYAACAFVEKRLGMEGAGFRNAALLLFSLVFYAWGEPVYVWLMIFTAAFDYVNARMMEKFRGDEKKRTIFFALSLGADISILCVFKYADLLAGTINSVFGTALPLPGLPLPVGISFFIFQTISYVTDVYRGRVKAQKSFSLYLTYLSMFPQLIAGPIVRYEEIEKELHERRGDIKGVMRFFMGLLKKVLLANSMGQLSDQARVLEHGGMAGAWLCAAAFFLQLYFDFSAYSDMAIGMGQMLGFSFPENFDHPLAAMSVTDFWRRWHMSLTGWFRDYVYIPLGGSRCSAGKHIRNIFIVWLLTGIWHGASWNFAIWGIYCGLVLVLEKSFLSGILKRLPEFIRHIYTLILMTFGFAIFSTEDMGGLYDFAGRLLGSGGGCDPAEILKLFMPYAAAFAACLVLAFPVYPAVKEKLQAISEKNIFTGLFSAALCVFMLALATAAMVTDTYNPFLYFRF